MLEIKRPAVYQLIAPETDSGKTPRAARVALGIDAKGVNRLLLPMINISLGVGADIIVLSLQEDQIMHIFDEMSH